MTLHDKVSVGASLASAAYLLNRALVEVDDAWNACIIDADYTYNTEFRDAVHNMKMALKTTEEIEKQFKEANRCTIP